MDWPFIKKDVQYIFLNRIVCLIPSWHIRCFFYRLSGMKIHKSARIGINTIIVSPQGIKIGKSYILSGVAFIYSTEVWQLFREVWQCFRRKNK